MAGIYIFAAINGMEKDLLHYSLEKLIAYIEREEFKGYDPYDTLRSKFPFKSFGKLVPVLAIQFQKRNPFNIRPLLGINRAHNPKAMGLFLHGYSLLQKHDEKDYSKQADFIFRWLKDNYSKGFSGYCWGYNFDWASSGKYIKAHSPNIVVTAFIARGIFAYYERTEDKSALAVLKSVGDFILKDLPRSEDKDGLCFSYTTLGKDCCYNASLLAASVLARLYYLTKDPAYLHPAESAVNYVVKKQHEDGHWNYSIEKGVERKQIDFHQGYVIDCIKEVMQYIGQANENWKKAVDKGLAFYRNEQFFQNGQGKWRLPKIYPVEIHNQSQGIITFCHEKEYVDFAKVIALFTIENMQDKKGFFYYRKLKYYTHKIPYMRWSQAWMFMALVELKITLQDA